MKRDALREFLKGLLVTLAPLGTLQGCPFYNCPTPQAQTYVLDGGSGQDGGGSVPDGGRSCEQDCWRAIQPGDDVYSCRYTVSAGGGELLECTVGPSCAGGRRPEGLAAPREDGAAGEVGRYLARMAHLEAASVIAFERLAAELAAHGAPSPLVERAFCSAREEERHARVMGALARRHGARPAEVTVEARGIRALEEVARENAVEGCVAETFGALVGLWQAEAAGEARVRWAMRAIAEEELGHAALAWDVAAWASSCLDEEARARLRQHRRQAARSLVLRSGAPVDAALAWRLGLPPPATARALAGAVLRTLWS